MKVIQKRVNVYEPEADNRVLAT